MSLQAQANTSGITITGQEWLIIVIIYLFLIAFHGYRFGDEDMTETLSYALYMNDHSLYPNDLYIQAVAKTNLNERYPFTLLLRLFSFQLEWASFFLHLLSSMLLISGLWTLAKLFLRSNFTLLAAILGTLVITYHLNLGGNEVWYNYFVPSQLAKSIGIWGLVFWLVERRILGYAMVALATFAQPVVGAQLALLFLLVDLKEFGLSRWKKSLPGPLLYFLTAGVWVMAVFVMNLISDHSIDGATFYSIMETRLAHHFFPSYYPLRSWVLFLPVLILGAFIWKRESKKMFDLFCWGFLGMLIYYLGIELFEIPSLLSVQWFKTTVWFKPLAIIAILSVVDKMDFKWDHRIFPSLLGLLLLTGIANLTGFVRWFGDKPYDLPGTQYHTAEMNLASQMKSVLPGDACILIPPDLTGIRYFSERSLFIDYKSNIHSKEYMSEAAERRRDLYGLTLDMRTSGVDMMAEMTNFYQHLSASDFKSFEKRGAQFVVTRKEQQLDLEKVLENSLFTLYKL
ncbi:MAG: hypothetical protein KDC80_04230 [Saprospiraceae bacterium]|nr:hypothetical protein [Saprospiraceae bacterium]